MILLTVIFAWLSIMICESQYTGAVYYVACSISYSFVSIAASIIWLKGRSSVLLAYASVNFLAAIMNYLMSDTFWYETLREFHFGPFHIAAGIIEILVLLKWGIDATAYINSRFGTSRYCGLHSYHLFDRWK